MSTKHEIKTIDDLVTLVTSDNREEFITAINSLFDNAILIKNMASVLGKTEPIKGVGFTWIDDGKKDITTTYKGVK